MVEHKECCTSKSRFNIYSLIEDKELNKDKKSLDYYTNNLKTLSDYILLRMRCKGLPECDSDIILSDLYISLINSRDYGDDSNDYNYTLESFVKRNADFCIDRYMKNYFDYSKNVESCSLTKSDGEEFSLLDTLEDRSASVDMERACSDFYRTLKSLEYKRNCFHIDVYILLFIGICNFMMDSNVKLKEALNIDSSDINKAYSIARKDIEFNNSLYSAVSVGSDSECLEQLKDFVYNFDELYRLATVE